MLQSKLNKENYNRVIKDRMVISSTEQQLSNARIQLKTVDQQIEAAYQQLNTLR